ncbi:sugar phosphate nucleotidyltransferase [Gammaproteobacteria bacterium]|nr:sugar phosphate nucleotidyltransferase [Gammaproteobacteria bacterium]
MKGIILAGGSGTRLQPITSIISKQLLPIFDKPMIFYPLVTLMELGIRDITIIVTPYDLERFKLLLGNGDKYGIKIEYLIQDKPNGLAEAFIITKQKIAGSKTTLVLGDNIFHSNSINENVIQEFNSGVKIFSYIVKDPERYGVIKYDEHNKVEKIVEKPKIAPSNAAVTGLYCYDEDVVELAESLLPSSRGELEITDLNNIYIRNKKVDVVMLDKSSIWLDSGTFSSLQESSNIISSLQKRNGGLIGSPESTALNKGWISKDQLSQQVSLNRNSAYFKNLANLLDAT